MSNARKTAPCSICGRELPLPKWPIVKGSLQCASHQGADPSARGLYAIAAAMNAELEKQSSMKIGAVIKHPDGYKVKVLSGQFLRNGRVSNWWEWRRVKADGTLGKKESGYGW